MDIALIEGYLRSACSVLDFDVGELWQAEKIKGHQPTLNFLQIYTSPLYDRSMRSLLLRPETSIFGDQTKAEEIHQISPVICRSVCDGGQIVWATSNVAEGLVENSTVRLATAVGMPICSVGGKICVIVLFATQHIAMTPNAIEFLCSMARAASGLENTTGFAKTTLNNGISPTCAKTDQFRGAWDISERLNSSYSAAIDFHLLPMERLQAFFDFQEVTSLNDICGGNSGGFSTKKVAYQNFGLDDFRNPNWIGSESGDTDDLRWLDTGFNENRVRSVSELSPQDGVNPLKLTADALMNTKLQLDQKGAVINSGELTINTDLGPTLPNSCSSSEIDENEEYLDETSLEFIFEDDVSRGTSSPVCPPCPMGFQRAIQVDARTSFRSNQSRFHEFMDAILGLTLFECTELWLLSEKTSDLYIVTALHRDVAVQEWSANAKGMRLSEGVDVPGIVLMSGRPHWDKNYNTRHLRNNGRKIKKEGKYVSLGQNLSPRSDLAAHVGMRTAFAVPLAGPSGSISGVLAMYSRAKVEPDALLLTLVHKSVQLISVSATVRPALSRNNSCRGVARFFQEHSEQASVLENPYSFFCHSETPVANSSPEKTAFPFRDIKPETKMEEVPPAPVYQSNNQVQGKRSWDRSASIPIPGSVLHRTVSANELIIAPQAIFHSHSMPDNMYLEGLYKMDVPRLKRARSIDLGTCTEGMLHISNVTCPTLTPAQNRYDPQIPSGVEIYGHHSIQWNPFMKPFDSDKIPIQVPFPHDAIDHIVRMPSYGQNVNQTQAPYENINMSNEVNKMHALGYNISSPIYQHLHHPSLAVPLISPVTAQVQVQTKIESSLDVLNAEMAFSNDFSFDHDLSFNYTCSPDDSLSSSAYPPCRVDGCEVDSSHRSPFCAVHAAGGRRCQQEGCNKCAQGSTCYCIAHGGGRRCTFPGCGKGARDKFFCAGHGGGKRCVSSDCTKSAVGGSKFCTGHGGGKRCKIDGCDKSAQSSTLHCVKHGGGRKCAVDRCLKVSRGKTDHCAAHGGGMRCRTAHCCKAAVGRYQYCRPHYSAIHGSESAAKMTEEEDDFILDEDDDIKCGDSTSTAA